MSEGAPVLGVILSHGSLAKGLVDAVSRIAGVPNETLIPVSNDGKSPEALREELSEIVAQGPSIIFTDLPSGSCAVTAHLCCREEGADAVITAVNLPILLDFVFNRDLPLQELIPRLVEKGRGSIGHVSQTQSQDTR
jgi:mannose/fructose-specific phosphotransferase system component IIA